MVEWSHAFEAPIYLPTADREWAVASTLPTHANYPACNIGWELSNAADLSPHTLAHAGHLKYNDLTGLASLR